VRGGLTLAGLAGKGYSAVTTWRTEPFAQVIRVTVPQSADWVLQVAMAGVVAPCTELACVLICE